VLQQLAEREKLTLIDDFVLFSHGLISKRERYKVLGSGVLKDRIDVSAYAFSASARASIEQLGGKATTIDVYA
jgi:large subunit ribosomal protein L15